jgi:NAD(P)-dependent dehydrogenase (short-subunit alcohol dehydrogenase family)
MRISFKPLHEQVFVITGASSGIGLATARAAAAKGARLVLSSRNEAVLSEAARDINAEFGSKAGDRGRPAIPIAADVGDRAVLQKVADAAIEHFGGFDTWVNNAGLSIWGRLEEVSDEDHRRLFQTNFWGTVYGSLIAVHHLKAHGGALINIGSVVSDVSFPLQGMYCASEHAIKGFTNSLRMELEQENAPVSVTLIKPAGIDTPFPHHARNYTDKEPLLPPPVYAPEEAANAILHAATHRERDIYVGGAGRMMSSLAWYAPRAMDWFGERVGFAAQLRDESPRNPDGALYSPGEDGEVHGDHPGYVMNRSLYTRASLHPVVTTLAVGAVGVAAAALLGRNGFGMNGRRGIGGERQSLTIRPQS